MDATSRFPSEGKMVSVPSANAQVANLPLVYGSTRHDEKNVRGERSPTGFAASPVRTHAQAQMWFRQNGLSVTRWSEAHGFNPNLVSKVLWGKSKGLRGQSHKVAVALGLKAYAEEIEPVTA